MALCCWCVCKRHNRGHIRDCSIAAEATIVHTRNRSSRTLNMIGRGRQQHLLAAIEADTHSSASDTNASNFNSKGAHQQVQRQGVWNGSDANPPPVTNPGYNFRVCVFCYILGYLPARYVAASACAALAELRTRPPLLTVVFPCGAWAFQRLRATITCPKT
jgi:hypothetical protein